MNTGVISMGIKCPIIREGDDIASIVTNAVMEATAVYNNGYAFSNDEPYWYDINNKDIIGITESIVARSQGNYATVDEIAADIRKVMNNPETITLYNCIYSRNRFAMILKAIARAAGKKVRIYMPLKDEVGNVRSGHKFTGVNYDEYFKNIVESEGKECIIYPWEMGEFDAKDYYNVINCCLHNFEDVKKHLESDDRIFTLTDFCKDKCKYGLLGSNKSTEEKLKLFPNEKSALEVCNKVKSLIKEKLNKDVIVCVYGDGCFKDPVGGIWEFADPVSMPAYTDADIIESTPNEIKIKAFADDQFKDLTGDELTAAVKDKIREKDSNLVGNMASQGTTPRLYRDLLASLMDLTSGSGDKGTPVILIKNYFKNYTND